MRISTIPRAPSGTARRRRRSRPGSTQPRVRGRETSGWSSTLAPHDLIFAHGVRLFYRRRRAALGHSVGVRRDRPHGGAARTHAERLASRDGYFAPESPIRRIGNTPLTPFLGGGPAVLLQVAHPLVAAARAHRVQC